MGFFLQVGFIFKMEFFLVKVGFFLRLRIFFGTWDFFFSEIEG